MKIHSKIFFAAVMCLSSFALAEVGSSAKAASNVNPPIRCIGRIVRTYEVNKITTSEQIIVKSLYIGSDYITLTYLRDGKETVRKFQTTEYMIEDRKISPQDASLYKFVGTKSGAADDKDQIEIRRLGKRLTTRFVRSADVKFLLDNDQVFSTLTCPL